MKIRHLFYIAILFLAATAFGATHEELHVALSELETAYDILVENGLDAQSTKEAVALKQKIETLKADVRTMGDASLDEIYRSTHTPLSNDFELLALHLYDWTTNYYRLVAHIRSTAMIYAENVKLYFTFYANGVQVAEKFSYIDFSSYGTDGVLPYYDSFLETYPEKASFDDIKVTVAYKERNGKDPFLCDQILQHVSSNIEEIWGTYTWEGKATNSSPFYAVTDPKIFAKVFYLNDMVETGSTFLLTYCQGLKTIVIQYVVTQPLEAQKITLFNCTDDKINISGWYLGDKNKPASWKIPPGTFIDKKSSCDFTNSDINFQIDKEDEIIFLLDVNQNKVDEWTENEQQNILFPLATTCYTSFLILPEKYDDIKYDFSYSLRSLSGKGNIPPNRPRFTLSLYELAPYTAHDFKLYVIDANDDPVEFQIDWGNNEFTGWLGPVSSRSLGVMSHAFSDYGDYWISARTRDSHGAVSNWSDPVRVFVHWTVPVELTSFSAVAVSDKVILTWETASETNNLGFAVESSSDKKSWSTLGFVPGHGTTVTTHRYHFQADAVTDSLRYYRLQQMDHDGSVHYSDIISVILYQPITCAFLSIYPNPFNAATSISYQLAESCDVQIDVYDIDGRFIERLAQNRMERGHHAVLWESGTKPSGTYFISISAGRHRLVRKCLVLK